MFIVLLRSVGEVQVQIQAPVLGCFILMLLLLLIRYVPVYFMLVLLFTLELSNPFLSIETDVSPNLVLANVP